MILGVTHIGSAHTDWPVFPDFPIQIFILLSGMFAVDMGPFEFELPAHTDTSSSLVVGPSFGESFMTYVMSKTDPVIVSFANVKARETK